MPKIDKLPQLPKIQKTEKLVVKQKLADVIDSPKSVSTVCQEPEFSNATKDVQKKVVFVNPYAKSKAFAPAFVNPYAKSASFNPKKTRNNSSKLSNNSSDKSNNLSALKNSSFNFATAVNG